MSATAVAKTERITFLGTPQLKASLQQEAKKEGISLSQLIRQRCERTPTEDEQLLLELIKEVRKSTKLAKNSLEQGLHDAEQTLARLRDNT